MSKIKNMHSDIKLIKRKKTKFQGIKITLFIVASLMLVIFTADIFSGFIVFGEFKFLSLFRNTEEGVVINEHEMFSLFMDKTSTHENAENLASFLSMQGAAAFIWEENNEFLIVGNIYSSLKDATAVSESISKTNPNCFVSEIKFKKVNLKLENYSKEQIKSFKTILNYIGEIINTIYDTTIKLDKKEITPTIASSQVNSLKSEAKIKSLNLDLINSTYVYESGIKIKNAYVKIIDILDELVIKLINSESYNHLSKFSYANIVRIKYDLFNNL